MPPVYQITATTTLGFAAFYTFYSSATVSFAGTSPDGGFRVAVTMGIVVATQLVLLVATRLVANRPVAVLGSVILMGIGSILLPVLGHWPGQILLGLGFGIMVVAGVAWVKEVAPPGMLGRALGIYGFGASVGGAIGAPLGLLVAEPFGLTGVAVTGLVLSILASLIGAGAQIRSRRTRAALIAARDAADSSPADIDAEAAAAQHSTRSGGARYVLTNLALFFGHLLAVTLYATVLSSLGSTSVAVTSALLIQLALALGRLVGGRFADRFSAGLVVVLGVALLVVATGIFAVTTGGADGSAVVLILTATLVGLCSGIAQSGALTGLMGAATTPRQINTASVGFNVGFDAGLGLGALVLALIVAG